MIKLITANTKDLANGMRNTSKTPLTDTEIAFIKSEIQRIGADQSVFIFNNKNHLSSSTCYNFVEDKIEDFTINCHADTQAVTYAKENGFGAVIEPHKAEKKPEFTW